MAQLVQGFVDDSSQSGFHVGRQLGKEVYCRDVSQHLGCTGMLWEKKKTKVM